ncbi:hypothetical protein KCP78_18230 [Salmonella enterica subsp. enterica]|nr:hypothetical protein KCP78_18230 [Salmonella enterica subsp. enterica]
MQTRQIRSSRRFLRSVLKKNSASARRDAIHFLVTGEYNLGRILRLDVGATKIKFGSSLPALSYKPGNTGRSFMVYTSFGRHGEEFLQTLAAVNGLTGHSP